MHLGMFQRAVGFDALRQVVHTEQFAGYLFEGGRKLGKICLGDAQAGCCCVPAEFFDERWMAFADQVQRVAQMQSSDRSEEHTSELQSPKDLVCRLLLE